MVYFRQLPLPLKEVDDWFISLFFNFATTFTEDSVLQAKCKEREKEKNTTSVETLRSIGYTDEDILIMGAQ